MFKGFIVLGVAFGVGYARGYLKGQEHTTEFKAIANDLYNSKEANDFVNDVREALKNASTAAESYSRDEELKAAIQELIEALKGSTVVDTKKADIDVEAELLEPAAAIQPQAQ